MKVCVCIYAKCRPERNGQKGEAYFVPLILSAGVAMSDIAAFTAGCGYHRACRRVRRVRLCSAMHAMHDAITVRGPHAACRIATWHVLYTASARPVHCTGT